MSAATARPRIAIVASDPAVAELLAEWLPAAGFLPCVLGDGAAAVVLVRWPVEQSLVNVGAPIVVLHDAGVVVPPMGASVVCVPWPDTQDVLSLLRWSSQLLGLLRRLTARDEREVRVQPRLLGERARRALPELVAIGVSTGGPAALLELFAALRGVELPPLLVVQHIPQAFVADLAARLSQQSGYRCVVAGHGEPVQDGAAYFAPGDRHLRVVSCGGRLHTTFADDAPRRGHRPSVDVLFESCALLRTTGVAVMMTGMGQDGAEGLVRLRAGGWLTLGQDEASCSIYGMPRAAKLLGAVEHELPLRELGPMLVAACRGAPLVPGSSPA